MRQYLDSMVKLIVIITENPHITWQHTTQAEGLTVWTCIWSKGDVGPYFFDDKVTAQSYLTMLNDHFYPVYRDLSGNESIFLIQESISSDLLDNECIFFMQNGAPARYAFDVREWLDENFPGKWIGRRGAID